MDTTAVVFTMWIGSFNYCGTDVGMVRDYGPACANVAGVRPTIDAEYEVVTDDTADQ